MRTPGFFPGFTCHVAIEVTRHFHYSLRTSRNSLQFQSQKGLHLFTTKLGQNLQVLPSELSFTALFLLQKRLMSNISSQNTGFKSCISGWELTKTAETRASVHVVALCRFSHTDESPFHRTTLEELPPKPLRLASWPRRRDLCDGFIDLHG